LSHIATNIDSPKWLECMSRMTAATWRALSCGIV